MIRHLLDIVLTLLQSLDAVVLNSVHPPLGAFYDTLCLDNGTANS